MLSDYNRIEVKSWLQPPAYIHGNVLLVVAMTTRQRRAWLYLMIIIVIAHTSKFKSQLAKDLDILDTLVTWKQLIIGKTMLRVEWAVTTDYVVHERVMQHKNLWITKVSEKVTTSSSTHYEVISEMNLSSHSLALVLTTKPEQPKTKHEKTEYKRTICIITINTKHIPKKTRIRLHGDR